MNVSLFAFILVDLLEADTCRLFFLCSFLDHLLTATPLQAAAQPSRDAVEQLQFHQALHWLVPPRARLSRFQAVSPVRPP